MARIRSINLSSPHSVEIEADCVYSACGRWVDECVRLYLSPRLSVYLFIQRAVVIQLAQAIKVEHPFIIPSK